MSSATVVPTAETDPAAAFIAAERGEATPGEKEGAYEIEFDSDSEPEEVFTEDDYQIRQNNLDKLDIKPRVVSCRFEKTGKDYQYLVDRATEKKAAEDRANNVVPLTEAEIEAKHRARNKLYDMNREKSREQALQYLEDMRISEDTLELDFFNRKIGKEDCERLHHLLMWNGLNPRRAGGLRYLILRCNAIKVEGCKHICDALKFDLAKGLRYLDLSECGLGPAGAQVIADMIRVDNAILELRIKENHISHEGTQFIADALLANHHLERLALNSNLILDIGAKHLADVSFGNLLFLDLRNNHLTTHGCKIIAEGLLDNVTLHHLNIRENRWGNEGRWAIGAAMKANKRNFVKAQKEVRKYQGKDYKIHEGTPEGPLWATERATEEGPVVVNPYGTTGENSVRDQVGCPSEEQIAWALPKIDFDGIRCEPSPFHARYFRSTGDTATKGRWRYKHHPTQKQLKGGCLIS